MPFKRFGNVINYNYKDKPSIRIPAVYNGHNSLLRIRDIDQGTTMQRYASNGYNWCHIYALNKHTIVTDGKWFNIVMFQCPMTSLVTFTNIPPYDYMYTCPYTSQCDYLFPKVYTCPYHIFKFSPYPLAVNTSIKFVASKALCLPSCNHSFAHIA